MALLLNGDPLGVPAKLAKEGTRLSLGSLVVVVVGLAGVDGLGKSSGVCRFGLGDDDDDDDDAGGPGAGWWWWWWEMSGSLPLAQTRSLNARSRVS